MRSPGEKSQARKKRRTSHFSRTSMASRSATGSILPFVALAMVMLVAYVGFSTDVMRNFLAVRKLQFASDAAALYGYSMYPTSVDGTGAFNPGPIQNAVLSAGASSASAWNIAPSGPADLFMGPWNSGVTFAASDIVFVPNPADATENFLQVTARRAGVDMLNQYFMPCLYAFNSWASAPVPVDMYQKDTYRLSEVVGQPASRIGAGAPVGSAAFTLLNGIAGCPIALSNLDFRAASLGNATYTLDFSRQSGPAAKNSIRACFVNLARGTAQLKYYADPTDGNVNQLVALLKYSNSDPASTPPAAIERGAAVGAFDPTLANFKQQQNQIVRVLQAVAASANPYLLCPVIENTLPQPTPDFNGWNKVQGFARVKVIAPVLANGNITCSIAINRSQSTCIRNASFANDFATIPFASGALMPAPVAPFATRTYNLTNNSLSMRPSGVALAPALSPRNVAPPTVAPTFN